MVGAALPAMCLEVRIPGMAGVVVVVTVGPGRLGGRATLHSQSRRTPCRRSVPQPVLGVGASRSDSGLCFYGE